MDLIAKFFSEDLMLRVSVAVTTDAIRKMFATQKPLPLASICLGRAMTGAVLMASQMKDGQRIGVHFNGNGPLGPLFAEANFEGEARAYCQNAQADLPLKDGKLDISGAIGEGILTVTRSQPFQKDPHRGIVPIVNGEISQDLAYYLFQSHQIPSVIALAVYLDGDGSVLASGGVLIEVLPGATEKLIATLERKSTEAPSLSKRLNAGVSPLELAQVYCHDSPLVQVEHPHNVKFVCKCNRERVDRTLSLFGRASLAEMALKGEDVPVTCEFCGKHYTVTAEEIRKILESIN